MEVANMSIAKCFYDRVISTPNAVALEYKNQIFTWKCLDDCSDKLADYFLEAGIKKNTHTGIFCQNNPQWICSFLALQKIGSIAILINPKSSVKEVEKIINCTDIEFLCVDKNIMKYNDSFQAIQSLLKDNSIRELIIEEMKDECYKGFIDKSSRQYFANLRNERLNSACILLTSGSTSIPKAVLLSHSNLIDISNATCKSMKWTDKDKICIVTPLFHILGLSGGLIASICCGCSMVISNDLIKLMKIIETYHCTILNGTPAIFLSLIRNQTLRKYDFSSLKSGYSAGAFLSGRNFKQIQETLGLKNFQISYGLTETSGGITFTSYDDKSKTIHDNVGKPLEGVEIKIADAIKNGLIGEVMVKGPGIMQKYYKSPDETKLVIDPEGWFHTGDLGYLDAEHRLHITGRCKEVIIWNGENVSPCEIEEIIMSYPGIVIAKVFGIKICSEQEDIVACIEMDAGEKFNEDNLRRYIGNALSYYKIPKFLIQLKKMPFLPNGKINLPLLRDIVEEKLIKTVISKE